MKRFPQLASHRKCTGCMACADICPVDAIYIRYVVDIPYPEVNYEKCIRCLQCESICPIINYIKRNNINDIEVYGGWSKDNNIRINGASGGAFGAIASDFFTLYKKVAIVGAALEDNKVSHIIITNKNELWRLQNSKYIQSYTYGIYKKTKTYLNQGYVILFSGTPCQIAGLYGYLGGKQYSKNLFTVEVVCHGVASAEALMIHLKYYDSKKIYSFRDKVDGQYWYKSQCTTINIDNVPHKLSRGKDIFYKIYAGLITERRSCSNCKYSSLPRIADITLADFWGGPFDKKEYLLGVSLIITNNKRANDLIKKTKKLYIFTAELKDAINSNPNLYCGYKFMQFHPIILFPVFFRKILPTKVMFAILTNKMPWKLIWGVYKVLTILYTKRIKTTILKNK
jgi:coenzyme F420-reducing hydrogenase beta subunit